MALAETARLVASLVLDDRYTRGVDKAIGKTDQLESRFNRIGATAARGFGAAAHNIALLGVVGVGALATQVVAGVKALDDLERANAQTKAVITSTGGAAGVSAKQVRDYAQAVEDATTVDDKAVQGAENLLLTFTGIGKDVFPQATKSVIDLGVAMAEGDVANADFHSSAIQIGKALNDPIKGLTALTRVGVSFTKQQKDQIKALVAAGKTEDAQRVILGELEREFGKAGAAASTGLGGDMRRLHDSVEDVQMSLATGFLPVISRVAAALSTKLRDPGTIKTLEGLGETLADAFSKTLDAASKIPWAAIGDAMKLAGTGAKAALDFFTGLPPWVQTAVLTGWGLNKLTGGALGSIVSELGKGLVKGVLGIQAATVNLTAATVVGGGGVPGAGVAAGEAGAAGGVAGKAGGLIAKGADFLSKALLVGLVAEIASEVHPLPSPTKDDLQWPFGPKNTPTILPEVFGGNGVLGGFAAGTPVPTPGAPAAAAPPVSKSLDDLNAQLKSALAVWGRLTIDAAHGDPTAARELPKVTSEITKLRNDIHLQTGDNAKLANVANERAEAIRSTVATAQAAASADSRSEQAVINAASASAKAKADTIAANAAATASAVREKDLRVDVNNYLTTITTVSVRDQILASTKFRQVQRFGGGAR